MATEKEWKEFFKRLDEALAKAEKMTDAELEEFIADLPEGTEFDDDDPGTLVAFAVKRRPNMEKNAEKKRASKKSHSAKRGGAVTAVKKQKKRLTRT